MQKKIMSTVGIAYFLLALITLVISYTLSFIIGRTAPDLFYVSLVNWVISLGPMYLVGMPVCKKYMDRLPKVQLYQKTITFGKWITIFCICICVMYIGNIIGNTLTTMISQLTPLDLNFDLQDLLMSDNLGMVFLFSVILAPILEELVFRKLLIDRIIVFGDKAAIFLSGFLFGLFHGNLYQLFYAYGLGCIFAYVYIRTGKIKYTISLHMAINFLGAFVSTSILRKLDIEKILSESFLNDINAVMNYAMNHLGVLIGYVCFALFMLVLAIIGLVFLMIHMKRLQLNRGEHSAPFRVMAGYLFKNVGMWLFIAISVMIFAINMA